MGEIDAEDECGATGRGELEVSANDQLVGLRSVHLVRQFSSIKVASTAQRYAGQIEIGFDGCSFSRGKPVVSLGEQSWDIPSFLQHGRYLSMEHNLLKNYAEGQLIGARESSAKADDWDPPFVIDPGVRRNLDTRCIAHDRRGRTDGGNLTSRWKCCRILRYLSISLVSPDATHDLAAA
jgi:hypothetical protein